MLVVCNGLPKSASSFIFQLTRDICEAAGHRQAPLVKLIQQELVPYKPHPYFISLVDDGIDHLFQVLPEDAILVVKAHGKLTPRSSAALYARELLGITTIRDPRDAVVSLIDAGFREKRRPPALRRFAIETREQAISVIADQYRWVRDWTHHPAVLAIDFEESKTFPFETAEKIVAHLGLDVAVFPIVRTFLKSKNQILEFNSGISGRYRSVLTLEEEKRCETLFGTTFDSKNSGS